MAVLYNDATKTARLAATILQIDAHASPAYIEIGTAAMAAVLVTITLSNDPSFTTAAGPPVKMDMAGAPKSGTATGTGTAAAARIRTGGAVDVITTLTVGTSGADINLNSTSITTGQTVTLTAGAITHG